mgnify:CR=1 FL=1
MAFDLTVANSNFEKRKNHLVTFKSALAETLINFFLLRGSDRRICSDCKVAPNKCLTTQHWLLVMDLGIKGHGCKKSRKGPPRIKQWRLD